MMADKVRFDFYVIFLRFPPADSRYFQDTSGQCVCYMSHNNHVSHVFFIIPSFLSDFILQMSFPRQVLLCLVYRPILFVFI